MSWSSRKKKEGIFCTFYIVQTNFFWHIVLSQCAVYTHLYIQVYMQIYFQSIYTFTYQKIVLHALFSVFLKSLKAFSVSLSFHINRRKIIFGASPEIFHLHHLRFVRSRSRPRRCSIKRYSWKFHKIHRKPPVSEPPFY